MQVSNLSSIYNNAASTSIPDKNKIAQSQKTYPGQTIDFEKNLKKTDSVTEKDSTLNRLNLLKSNLNEVAKSIKIADRAMETIEQHIDKMKEQLKQIVKRYPPFPPGSEERIKILKNFSSERKFINSLTIPPIEEDFVLKISALKNAIQEDMFDITELTQNNTDMEINASFEKFETVKKTIQQNRKNLKNETHALNFSSIYNKINNHLGESANMQKINPEHLSLELKHNLLDNAGSSITEKKSVLKNLL